MIEVKLRKILETKGFLENLINEKLPMKISFKISRVLEKVNAILKTYQDIVNEKIKEYGVQQEDGTFKFDPENEKKINSEISDAADQTVTIDACIIEYNELPEKISRKNSEGKIESFDFTIEPNALLGLNWLIVDSKINEEKKEVA